MVSTLDSPVVVSEEIVYRHRLKEGIVITTFQLERLLSESEMFHCDRTVARLLAMREHSVGEIRVKLSKRRFSSDMIRQVVKKYKDQGMLDDVRFALEIAKSLIARRPCGRSYLTGYLRRKLIDRALAEQTTEAVLTGKNEIELAVSALEKRWTEFSRFELEVTKRKSYNYLARRGFSYEAAKVAFEKLQRQQHEVTKD